MADLFTPASSVTRLAEHQVRTLPALVHALHNLSRIAADRRDAAVNLAGVDPLRGVTVSLDLDERGLPCIRFEGLAS